MRTWGLRTWCLRTLGMRTWGMRKERSKTTGNKMNEPRKRHKYSSKFARDSLSQRSQQTTPPNVIAGGNTHYERDSTHRYCDMENEQEGGKPSLTLCECCHCMTKSMKIKNTAGEWIYACGKCGGYKGEAPRKGKQTDNRGYQNEIQ